MLVSKTKQGEWFSLAENRNQGHLKAIRQKENFYCPECGEQVILKIGTKRMTHFAHQKGAACHESYERESEYHLKGKITLYEWLESKGLLPVLEPYYKEIAQRPDIGFNYNGVQFALEYQCSVIPEELFIKRTETYLKANITPIWLMAGKNIKRKGNTRAALSGFDYLFLVKDAFGNWRLPAFCPVTNTFITMHHIIPVSVKNVLTQFTITNLKSAKLSILLDPICKTSLQAEDWLREIRKVKLYITHSQQSLRNKYLQELYAHSIIPSFLPPEIGLPVPHAPYIETPAVQWQSYLFMDILNQQEWISMEQILISFRRRVRNKDVRLRKLPLNSNVNPLIAVKEYINLLVKVNILQEVGTNRFRKINSMILAENQTQQMELEKAFYGKYGKFIFKSLFKDQS
ncbi:hypothetical protein BGM26_00535 [Bacillus sp. FJAT-29790]|uniref:competence protein CoiA n=1 Tax=Bacillus sp. FJAT-29790 TaxID=1895002 RepID=UPI001C23126E|nr:competence protein CoiA family protein [Bacillus sp. FJAT-29790]MBU8877473.1 hypothetical protein [Bacillus sp. FJAT-29790]